MFNIFSNQGNATQTTMRFILTSVRMPIIKNKITINAGKDMKEKGTLICCSWEHKLVQPL